MGLVLSDFSVYTSGILACAIIITVFLLVRIRCTVSAKRAGPKGNPLDEKLFRSSDSVSGDETALDPNSGETSNTLEQLRETATAQEVRRSFYSMAISGLSLDIVEKTTIASYSFTHFSQTDNSVCFRVRTKSSELFVKVIRPLNSDPIRSAYRYLEEVRRNYGMQLGTRLCFSSLRKNALPIHDIESGMLVGAADIVVMPFVVYPSLFEFIRDACVSNETRKTIRIFASHFRKFVEFLHKVGAAHGDLNAENICVDCEMKPFLIDFDSFSVSPDFRPALRMVGTGGFQPPAKFRNRAIFENFPHKVDYFPEWVIYLSLVVYVDCPEIEGPKTSDSLLLSVEELFLGIEAPSMRRLVENDNPIISRLAKEIVSACGENPEVARWRSLEEIFTDSIYRDWEEDKPRYPTLNLEESVRRFGVGNETPLNETPLNENPSNHKHE